MLILSIPFLNYMNKHYAIYLPQQSQFLTLPTSIHYSLIFRLIL